LLDGYVTSTITIAGRAATEILGPGDVLLPGIEEGSDDRVQVTRQALTPSQIAILDDEFAQRVARWPAITRNLHGRSAQRIARLAILRALMFHPHVEARVALLLDHLAQRWGKMSARGARLAMPLTHDLLANLAGAARPSVSRALSRLVADGIVERDGKGWRLLIDTAEMDEYVSRRVPPCPAANRTPVLATVSPEPAEFSTQFITSTENSSQTA
jgi:CRP-like cAMP-binding protein